MFWWAVAIGAYSYALFFLGILGQLTPANILVSTVLFLSASAYLSWRFFSFQTMIALCKSKFNLFLMSLIGVQFVVNVIGALGPELGFDAIWYHLTIQRIWLLEETIFYIPGGPFDYSLLPKMIDLLYLAPLAFADEILAKVIHCIFGLLCVWVTYKLTRTVLSQKYSLLAAVIFYANLVVGWQSITAYIDLGRTFYEGLTLLAFVYFIKFKQEKWLWWCAVFLGLAVSSKLLTLGSVGIFVALLLWQKKYSWAMVTGITALLIPAPWFLVNFLATGNPIFPVFGSYDLSSQRSIWDIVTIWLTAADPISPIYLMISPLFLLPFFAQTKDLLEKISFKNQPIVKTISIYCGLSLFVWWILPRTGGGRFLLPYLPAFSVLGALYIDRIKDIFLQKTTLGLVLGLALISIVYRGVANAHYLPVILGKENKNVFLQKNLDFNFSENWYYLTDESLRQVYGGKPDEKPFEWSNGGI